MDSIVKLLLALIIGYCFVKLFCGCSVEGMEGKKIIEEIIEEGEEIEEFLKEKYNPTPTPASNGVEVGNWISDCPAGQSPGGFMDAGCDDCSVGKYNNGHTDDKCVSCPAGSYPVDKNGSHVTSGAVGCQFCGFLNDNGSFYYDRGRAQPPYEFPEDTLTAHEEWSRGRGRYLDGNTCKECPEHSTLKPGVKDIDPGYSWWSPEQGGWRSIKLHGGRNVNDCICRRGYIKVTNEGGGFICQKCDTDNKKYPNKPPEQNPDKCVELGGDECPYIKFSQGTCNDPTYCGGGYKAIILPGGDGHEVACVKKD